MTSHLPRDMRVKYICHGRVSSVVDSSIPVGLLKEKELSSPTKCSYKVNLNFHRRSSLYLLPLSKCHNWNPLYGSNIR